jgi:Ser/Thr protein kinase RdoA (MazF antagonist)
VLIDLINVNKQNKIDFEKILSNYSFGELVSYKHLPLALENTVFKIKTTKNNYILKIFGKKDFKTIKQQTIIQEHLQKNNPIPKIILNNSKKSISFYNNNYIQIQEFVKGKRVKLNNSLIKDFGKTIGNIDNDLKKLRIKNFFPFGKEFEFKKMKTVSNEKMNLAKEHKKLLSELKKLDKKKLSKSIVHGDINLDNSLIYKNKINAIIDFGDSHTGYLITDPMIFICDEIITSKMNYNKIRIFLKEYEKKIRLNSEEKKAIYYFSKLRCIYSMDWCNRMQKKHKKSKRSEKLFEEYYKKYFLLEKEDVENFVKNVSIF